MRSEEEIRKLSRDLDEGLLGGVKSGTLIPMVSAMQLLARWVLGEDNLVCDLVRSFEVADREFRERVSRKSD